MRAPANRFGPDVEFQPTDWVNFEEDQPMDISPAVGAFQQRFMNRPPRGSQGTPPEMNHPLAPEIEPLHNGGNASTIRPSSL